MNSEELQAAIDAKTAPKVTLAQMLARVSTTQFNKLGPTLTHCALHLDNGFIVTGESACVSPENYDQAIGEKIARDNAINKLWPLFGFLLAESKMQMAAKSPATTA